jgi:DNA-binding LytR/AlgR family response regulator
MIYGTYLVVYKGLKDAKKFFEYKEIIEQLPKDETSTYYNLAVLNKLLGKPEQSIEYLGKTLQTPLFLFTFTQYDEFWEEYHEHPRFQDLITSKYKGTGNQLITLNSETKEFVELSVSDFIYAEAQDNYTLIVYKEKKIKKEKILRATISHIENQLKFHDIIRCHRSYLVNLKCGYKYVKSDNKALLKLAEWDISIPVSRTKEKEVKEWISC